MNMAGGRIWGSLFFLFMTFASFSTVIAVFENLLASCIDNFGWSRKQAVLINGIFVLVASMPCVLGYNVWSDLHLIGGRDVLDSEDSVSYTHLHRHTHTQQKQQIEQNKNSASVLSGHIPVSYTHLSITSGYSIGSYDAGGLTPPIELRRAEDGAHYRGIGKGSIYIEHLPVVYYALGPFGNPTSDSRRAMIQEGEREIISVLYAFDGPEPLRPWLQQYADALERYCGCLLYTSRCV